MIVTSMVNLDIDLGALEHNYRQLRRLCEPQVKMLAVVKADAYGHGLLPAARTLARAGADYLGVGSLEEGLTLRQAGFTLPILLLLGILPREAERAVAADLEVTLFRQDVAQALAAAARSQTKPARVHLKVDTGMGRLGLLPGEVPEFLAGLKEYRQLEVLGLISHLAVADLEDKTYTLRQLQEFTALLAAARGQGWALPLSHISNSAALWEHQGGPSGPGAAGPDALRLAAGAGPAAAGGTPAGDEPDHRGPPGEAPAAGEQHQLRLHLHHRRTGCDLAVLPIGYCNGYNRLLSNRGEVLIQGRRAPIRGRVCMNLTMVEVTGIPGVKEGDRVTLMGPDGDDQISAEELAAWADTISYEVYCILGSANLRRYQGA